MMGIHLIAYSRILPPGIPYPDAASIGRVLTAPLVRKRQAGKQLIQYPWKIYIIYSET